MRTRKRQSPGHLACMREKPDREPLSGASVCFSDKFCSNEKTKIDSTDLSIDIAHPSFYYFLSLFKTKWWRSETVQVNELLTRHLSDNSPPLAHEVSTLRLRAVLPDQPGRSDAWHRPCRRRAQQARARLPRASPTGGLGTASDAPWPPQSWRAIWRNRSECCWCARPGDGSSSPPPSPACVA